MSFDDIYWVPMNVTQREEFLPLTPQTYYILLALAKKHMAGYEIMQQIRVDAGDVVRVGNGALYPALRKLFGAGFINELDNDGVWNPGKPRRIYELTDMGRNVLSLETGRIEAAAKLARERLQISKAADLADAMFSD